MKVDLVHSHTLSHTLTLPLSIHAPLQVAVWQTPLPFLCRFLCPSLCSPSPSPPFVLLSFLPSFLPSFRLLARLSFVSRRASSPSRSFPVYLPDFVGISPLLPSQIALTETPNSAPQALGRTPADLSPLSLLLISAPPRHLRPQSPPHHPPHHHHHHPLHIFSNIFAHIIRNIYRSPW